jgi:hypothetical protein
MTTGAIKLKGVIRVRAFKRGRLLWTREIENTVVDAHAVPTANLLGGDVANNSVTAIGWGSGVAAAAAGDTVLTAPAYYKAVTSHSYPVAGKVRFAFALIGGTDTGANGINLQELGLFCNTGPASLPFTQPSGAPPSMTLFARQLMGLGVYSSALTFNMTWDITT